MAMVDCKWYYNFLRKLAIDASSNISINHTMLGEIGAWLYEGSGRIKLDPQQSSFKNIYLESHFVSDVDRFEAKHSNPYKNISPF